MSGLPGGDPASKKRRKNGKEAISRKRLRATGQEDAEPQKLQQLEGQISESRKHYNNIVTLLSMLDTRHPNLPVAVSLCRVFCRLLAGGHLQKAKGATEQDSILAAWLGERYQEYKSALIRILGNHNSADGVAALTLSMRLVKEHSIHYHGTKNYAWDHSFFNEIIDTLIEDEAEGTNQTREEFSNKFLKEYHDVAVYTVLRLLEYTSTQPSSSNLSHITYLLSGLGTSPSAEQSLDNVYTDISKMSQKNKAPFVSVSSYRKRVQSAWLAVLSNTLDTPLRKQLLQMMPREIAPWFLKPELLMDFLTDSYNQGGSISLLALSGLFYLIQQKNLDYPQFYHKLYSLLNADLLHSKYRSRFFRLLDTFLASTHLPATLVASFIKRLSRLTLNAPPAAIVIIVPWIYNLLRNHPLCTFMIHRAIRDPSLKSEIDAEGMDDPFDPFETDPTLTAAIESSLWEIEMLQSHYHPNVAAVAKIISEQFTKPVYNLEDFLDHSYHALLDADLGVEEKPFKKTPVVEYQIPKRIFTDRLLVENSDGKDIETGTLLRQVWDFS
ncbi:Maturation and nuclear export of 40S ribosomal subunits interacting protein [Ophidiomyces ophidiicola]|uniref:Maturation and nuclear export of 40S ribosomal subunits interacting protein n=1 Tax=Ophidiomyces ophidiicola TaxID=1387563 RepID=A0ACB8UTE7_9EURO|nr:Maturation and nuclear export of 40S ribosomal subunits interacting protein [Ophidiomyces ophidiicola]KAI1906839.1 Maturation and nuclear export of 40S ribosomal subunits interacting protein [Ophidiomyces ophidiicola]KAI1907606.1 Maturation and nuclear export of 40S ribosomal subunits interacting protein [Ophidiomyces ophidiicola]KAI1922868.1 Maturation and nuclear export of 40S ribosomal subunits interacting protein [Ophidiomyces ophidiicola]KAI1939829.1 Maturation and nuclear export of 40S